MPPHGALRGCCVTAWINSHDDGAQALYGADNKPYMMVAESESAWRWRSKRYAFMFSDFVSKFDVSRFLKMTEREARTEPIASRISYGISAVAQIIDDGSKGRYKAVYDASVIRSRADALMIYQWLRPPRSGHLRDVSVWHTVCLRDLDMMRLSRRHDEMMLKCYQCTHDIICRILVQFGFVCWMRKDLDFGIWKMRSWVDYQQTIILWWNCMRKMHNLGMA